MWATRGEWTGFWKFHVVYSVVVPLLLNICVQAFVSRLSVRVE